MKRTTDHSDLPPESSEEKAYSNPLWDDPQQETPVTELDTVKAKLVDLTKKTSSGPVSAPLQSIPEKPSDVPTPSKVGRKPTGKAMTNSERQKKWRAANRQIALQRQRDAMKKIRDQKKGVA